MARGDETWDPRKRRGEKKILLRQGGVTVYPRHERRGYRYFSLPFFLSFFYALFLFLLSFLGWEIATGRGMPVNWIASI